MTIVVQNVGRVRNATEPNGSFATEIAIGSFSECPVIEGSSTLVMDQPFETPKLLQQYIYGYPSKVKMPKRASFSFTTNIKGLLSRASGAATAMDDHGGIYTVAFGGGTAGTGTTVASTSTTTVINCTSASGLTAGGAIVCATGAGGALECREIKSISTNAVTVKRAFSSIPANGSTVYACYTFYLGSPDGGSIQYLQTVVEGINTADRWLLKGGQISAPPVFKLAPGTIPTIDWAWQYAQHAAADGSEATMNLNSALADQNYVDTSINAVMDSDCALTPHASTTATVIDASEINIVPNIAVEPHTTPGGTNNIKQWVPTRVDGPPVTANFLLPHQDNTWRTARDAETPYALTYQVGSSTAGGGFMISVPFVVVDNFQREAVGGLAGQRVSLYARQDTQTSGSTSLSKSPIKIHFF